MLGSETLLDGIKVDTADSQLIWSCLLCPHRGILLERLVNVGVFDEVVHDPREKRIQQRRQEDHDQNEFRMWIRQEGLFGPRDQNVDRSVKRVNYLST